MRGSSRDSETGSFTDWSGEGRRNREGERENELTNYK